MKLKTENLKLKVKAGSAAFTAGLLTLLLHAAVFSVPGVISYLAQGRGGQKPAAVEKGNQILIDVSVLPDIEKSAEKDEIKKNEGEKKPQNEESGAAAPAEKDGASDAGEETLTYKNIIKQKIQRARRYPAEAKRGGVEGSVELEFMVLKSGELKDVSVLAGSGSAMLD